MSLRISPLQQAVLATLYQCEKAEDYLNDPLLTFTQRTTTLETIDKIYKSACEANDSNLKLRLESIFSDHDFCYIATDATALHSQGFSSIPQGGAMMHMSTIPLSLIKSRFPNIASQGVNMDRGFVAKKRNIQFASIADGVGGAGINSLHVAQMCVNMVFQRLTYELEDFAKHTAKQSLAMGQTIFHAVGETLYEQDKYERGSTTCAFAVITQSQDKIFVDGAAIGDSEVIHYDHKTRTAAPLTVVSRNPDIPNDSGGQIMAKRGVCLPQKICGFTAEIDKGDVIILCTDGLTDNIRSYEVIASVLQEFSFNHPKKDSWEGEQLPTAKELLETRTSTLNPKLAVQRLSNYVEWVTRNKNLLQKETYFNRIPGKLDDSMVIAMMP